RLEHLLSMAETRNGTEAATPAAGDASTLGVDPITGEPIDPRDLEAFDEELARLGRLRDEARLAMERARERFMPRHRAYGEAEETLRIAERLYRERQKLAAADFSDNGRLSLVNWAME